MVSFIIVHLLLDGWRHSGIGQGLSPLHGNVPTKHPFGDGQTRDHINHQTDPIMSGTQLLQDFFWTVWDTSSNLSLQWSIYISCNTLQMMQLEMSPWPSDDLPSAVSWPCRSRIRVSASSLPTGSPCWSMNSGSLFSHLARRVFQFGKGWSWKTKWHGPSATRMDRTWQLCRGRE